MSEPSSAAPQSRNPGYACGCAQLGKVILARIFSPHFSSLVYCAAAIIRPGRVTLGRPPRRTVKVRLRWPRSQALPGRPLPRLTTTSDEKFGLDDSPVDSSAEVSAFYPSSDDQKTFTVQSASAVRFWAEVAVSLKVVLVAIDRVIDPFAGRPEAITTPVLRLLRETV